MFLKRTKLSNFAKNISTNHKINSSVFQTFVDSSDNILVMGAFTNYKKSQRSYLVSLNNDAFSSNFYGKFNTTVSVLEQQLDGKILIGGNFSNYGGTTGRNCLLRLNSDLTLDTAFCANAVDGNKIVTGSGIQAIAIQPDGKILISGGGIVNYSGYYTLLRLNSDGTLDTAFCTNASSGIVLNGTVEDIIVQPDGKILIAGSFQNYKSSGRNALARLNSDGTLDTTFCANATDGSKFQTSTIYSISLQSDGKIIVGGSFTIYGGTAGRARLIRLNSDGTLDTNFCINASDGTKFSVAIYTIKLQPDGKIVVGGGFTNYAGTAGRSYLIRLNSDGTLDTDFCINASDGSKFGTISLIRSIYLQVDGKILVGGVFSNYSSTAGRNNLIRLNSDGTLDNAFCISYIDYLPDENLIKFNNSIRSLANQSDNKLLIGGAFTNFKEISGRSYLIRINSDGNLDTDFCVNAVDGTKFSGVITTIAVQSDNKIIVGGSFTNYAGTTGRNRLIRLNSDGTLDTDFCVNAVDGTKFSSSVLDINIQSDGKIVVSGQFISYAGTAGRSYLIRLNSDGTLDATFCNNASDGSKFNNSINKISVQSDGKIIVGGGFSSYGGTTGRNRLIRLNSDGTLDTTFCANATDGTKFNNVVNTISVQQDGKIVIGGIFSAYAGTTGRGNLVRLNSDGTLDTTFCINAVDGTKFNNSIITTEVQPDSKIIVGGSFTNYAGTTGRNRLIRLNSDGTLDTDFCNNSTDGTKFNNFVQKIITYSTDIIVGGDFTSYSSADRNKVFERLLILNTSGYAK